MCVICWRVVARVGRGELSRTELYGSTGRGLDNMTSLGLSLRLAPTCCVTPDWRFRLSELRFDLVKDTDDQEI